MVEPQQVITKPDMPRHMSAMDKANAELKQQRKDRNRKNKAARKARKANRK